MTEVYLIRHSEKYRNFNNIINDDSFQLFNEKIILSINGEMLANKLANMEEMSNIDVVFASNYVRSIGTAKYIAYRNKIDVNIDKNFGERIYGINSVDEIKKLEPFGESNKMPIFIYNNVKINSIRTLSEGRHLKLSLCDGSTFVDAIRI